MVTHSKNVVRMDGGGFMEREIFGNKTRVAQNQLHNNSLPQLYVFIHIHLYLFICRDKVIFIRSPVYINSTRPAVQ